jgi:signal transduction histidine kinase
MALSLGKKIGLGFGLALFTMTAVGAASIKSMALLLASLRSVEYTQRVVGRLESIFHELLNVESASRGYVLTGDPSFLATYEASLEALQRDMGELRAITEDNPSHKRRLSEIAPLVETKVAFMKRTVDVRKTAGFEAAQNLVRGGEGLGLMEDIRRLLGEMEAEERARLGELRLKAGRTAERTRSLILFGTAAAFLLLSLVSFVIFRGIAHSVSQLIDGTRKMGEGMLHHRIKVGSRDEFGRIGEALNQMAQRLNEAQEELERTNEELRAKTEELEAFTYSVSHDLRAPLRHIDGFSELLQKNSEKVLDEKSRHYLETISKSVKHMGTLIDDLLLFSRMGRAEMRSFPVNMEKLARDALSDFAGEIASRGVAVSIAPLPTIQGDPAMLRLVFVNLFSNALKFTRHIEKPTIEVGAECHEGEAVFFVRDNGAGFDMKYTGKLFGVFQRLHHQHEFEGTGIGLANVRRIVSRHGGRTWAEGAPGCGATIYFSLPLKEATV